jgi:HPt (histidine-containing phosphotransfer) domain-containing protein
VFLDIGMPRLDGLTLMKRMRGLPIYAKLPIIAVTAHLLPEQRSSIMAEGFDDVLIKPVMLSDLQKWIARLSNPPKGSDVDVYADILLEKVSFNRNLGEVLLKKLLIDMPAQFDHLELALQRSDLEEAKATAHKIHGGFCFYGFDDFKKLALSTEQALLDNDLKQAGQHFQTLRHQFRGLMRERSTIFERLSSQGH